MRGRRPRVKSDKMWEEMSGRMWEELREEEEMIERQMEVGREGGGGQSQHPAARSISAWAERFLGATAWVGNDPEQALIWQCEKVRGDLVSAGRGFLIPGEGDRIRCFRCFAGLPGIAS